MKKPNSTNNNSVNFRRRKIIQGMGTVVAVTIAAPAFSSPLGKKDSGLAKLSGRVISQVGAPVKTLILRNDSDEVVTIDHFVNGGLMFDGEILDCSGACIDAPVALSSKKEMLVQFDKRHLFKHDSRAKAYLNVQSSIQRMSAGTRVIEISGTVTNRVVTLVPTSDVVYS